MASTLASPRFESIHELAVHIKRLLIQNHRIWKNSGPESDEAKRNPMSNLSEIWDLRKVGSIVPNNRSIINSIRANETLFQIDELDSCYEFIEHAEGFEQNCYSRKEGVIRFPVNFQMVVDKYVV